MAAQSLIRRPSDPATRSGRSIANVGTQEQAVQLTPRQGTDKRTVPTELFVTSISLRRIRTKSRTAVEESGKPYLENADYARLALSQDGLLGVFNGFWWASSAEIASDFWSREFQPPYGYEAVARETVMIPRHLLEKDPFEKIGRARVYLTQFALAGMTLDRRGRHTAYASYIRADSIEMAVRLWQTHAYGVPSSEKSVVSAVTVPRYWIKAVLASPPIMQALEHDRLVRLGR